MREGEATRLDLLDSLRTLEHADIYDLMAHTGRGLRQVQRHLLLLGQTGRIVCVGRSKTRGGQPPKRWAITVLGREQLEQEAA